MSVTINGTSGVTTPGIANSEGYTGDGLTIAAGAPAGAVTLDASGNLGVGTTSPSARLHVSANDLADGILISGNDNNNVKLRMVNAGAGGNAWQMQVGLQGASNSGLWFRDNTAGATRMGIDASGNLMVGTTSDPYGSNYHKLVVSNKGLFQSTDANQCLTVQNITGSGTRYYAEFRVGSGIGGSTGSITTTGTTTAYNTSSDYRLKENVAPLINALDKIALLKPVTYTWKADGSADRGFIAHELQEVIPQAVSGEKDAVDDEGNIRPQGVDYGKIIPEIVAALQEAYVIITELKARIEQLEAK